MKKIKAPTLEAAYEKASIELRCSITDLQYEVIQHPSKGFLGLFKKEALIVASCNSVSQTSEPQSPTIQKKPNRTEHIQEISDDEDTEVITKDSNITLEEDEIVEGFFSPEYLEHDDEAEEVEEELPSVEDFIEKEPEVLEEAVQTIEDAEGKSFAEVKDIIPPFPELIRLINDVRKDIPDIPEVKYYDKETDSYFYRIHTLTKLSLSSINLTRKITLRIIDQHRKTVIAAEGDRLLAGLQQSEAELLGSIK